ncbi:class I SAM-dependent methyltransferase [Mycobacterium sp. 663a-19]|uniref:phthiotriol/phenolphthiotriol dimycocerosates methyltransferase n=1 Tax=Mycobacterium sp. 663a-19 TaxID=2986148 RepID=UPI002D1E8256|nr:class I SAM-dependent methyltransferase [Mycobacterium sp. 663a-19]MEB3981080.1 class I SAM-dependent methyltransferase [Mycobacterium sp. 663a-19]
MSLISRVAQKFTAEYWYRLATRHGGDHLLFLCWGYEEDPPMALPLTESDEPDRYAIQLYHRTATQVDLTGKRVLEVSCGHGGGASYLLRTLGPASYTGLDLNRAGVDFCRERYNLPGLDFVYGSAENLPFADQSFDAVINVEASSFYPSLPRFLTEVARVLRPGGHFLYTDVRSRQGQIAKWEKELGDAPMRLMSERDISEQVDRGLEKNVRLRETFPVLPAFLVDRLIAAFRNGLQNGENSYRMYCFLKEEARHTAGTYPDHQHHRRLTEQAGRRPG